MWGDMLCRVNFIYYAVVYKYSGDMMQENSSLENIELNKNKKIELKTVSVQHSKHMRDLIIEEAHKVIDEGVNIPRLDRDENRTSLIIEVSKDFKNDIKNYCDIKNVRIRDFWVECVNRVLEVYQDGN